MTKSMMTGGELLVACLSRLGVTTGFGVPGESYLAVLDALFDADISFTLCRHESAAGFAAAAWGKITGQPGIGFVTRGPGATNASIGVHTAMQDSSPMILFIGQVGVDHKGREAFQEGQPKLIMPIVSLKLSAGRGILPFLGGRALWLWPFQKIC
jgi:acetolactate synthase-1/2/3 large subunit